ncbi:PEP-CTERM sorting domain-containing protein [Rubellicoccus peritrichatus]|uniref:PEP-CTERM sorting domain-containing protein n=1 Tax=Rubellicoccus peritrichatus TaxID=3080537 RepID=A0AAQ3LBD6_9BACT|nr:PEP-CTERM sorting domain-containing protein [Puniceicoccus sp. CR14]WOO42621.1 PEP-CTERM sorting domain-containing protein [Puniceicoccus sp. CR14]
MKQFATLLAIGVLSTSMCPALVFFSEDFDYPDGVLTAVSGGNWTNFGGSTNELTVSSGQVALSQAAAQTEDVKRSFGTSITSGSVYASLDFSVNADSPASGGDYEYFVHFSTDTDPEFIPRVDIVAPNSGGDFTLGISFGPFAEVTWATDLLYSTTYNLVIRYNRDTELSTLWIDPTSESDTSITTIAQPGFNYNVNGLNLRQSTSSPEEIITVDNIFAGTTFADVAPIPEPSTYAALGGFIALGVALLRRTRR